MASTTDTFRTVLVWAVAGLLAAATGCSPYRAAPPATDAGSATDTTDADTMSGGADAATARDGTSSPDGAKSAEMFFLMSGPFRGSVWFQDEDSTVGHRARALVSEVRDSSESGGRIEGILTIFESDGTTPKFEYVLEGTLNRERTVVRLNLSARRCPFGADGNCSNALPADQVPDEPMFRGRATFADGRLQIHDVEVRSEFEPPPGSALEPKFTGAGLVPEFETDGSRLSPGDGVKPTGLDATIGDSSETGPIPMPLGRSIWSGMLTNGAAAGGAEGNPVSCGWTVYRDADGLELRFFVCDGRNLRNEESDTAETPRVVPGSFGWKKVNGVVRHLWVLVEGAETHHLFVGERIGPLFSGVVVRNPEVERTSSGATRPAHPRDYEANQIEGAFHWKRDQ